MLKTLTDCGELILQINQSAYEAPADDFQRRVLAEMDRYIGFDRAWWGVMSPTENGFSLLSSHQTNLPDSYVEKWRAYTSDDRLAISVHDSPAHTVQFGTSELHSTKGLYEINADVGNKHALCTAIRLPGRLDDFVFLSLFRGGKSRPFDKIESEAKQFLMPHVFMGWHHNLMRNQESSVQFPAGADLPVSAFVDLECGVLNASARFLAAMRIVWPSWMPPRLPASLIQALKLSGDRRKISFRNRVFSLQPAGSMQRLTISIQSALDVLTARELQIAQNTSKGLSYKEVARILDISPATVRHYLREIYRKLEISNKSELTTAVLKASPEPVERTHADVPSPPH